MFIFSLTWASYRDSIVLNYKFSVVNKCLKLDKLELCDKIYIILPSKIFNFWFSRFPHGILPPITNIQYISLASSIKKIGIIRYSSYNSLFFFQNTVTMWRNIYVTYYYLLIPYKKSTKVRKFPLSLAVITLRYNILYHWVYYVKAISLECAQKNINSCSTDARVEWFPHC